MSRGADDEVSKQVAQLNEYMFAEDKAARDSELAEWFFICGTGFRMILPDPMAGIDPDDSPFEIDILDPRYTFVVYHSGFGNKPLMGVTYIRQPDNIIRFSVYTQTHYYEIIDDKIVTSYPHALGDVPIIEYPANKSRLGAFEVVLGLLDALNTIASNRIDGIEQFVQAFMKFVNCDIDEEEFKALKELGAIKIKGEPGNPADVDIVSSELDQTQVQVTKNDLYQMVLMICGMPDRNAPLGRLAILDKLSCCVMGGVPPNRGRRTPSWCLSVLRSGFEVHSKSFAIWAAQTSGSKTSTSSLLATRPTTCLQRHKGCRIC